MLSAPASRACAGAISSSLVEIDSDNAAGMGSPGGLERDIAPSASDIEAVHVMHASDAIERLAGARRHRPRHEAQPLAPLWPAPDDVHGLAAMITLCFKRSARLE